jgi:hypothetical protein
MVPKCCPVCCSPLLEIVVRDAMLDELGHDLLTNPTGTLKYQCDRGHLFLVLSGNVGPVAPVRGENGYSIFL